MEAPIVDLTRCGGRAAFASIFTRHLQASVATFAISSLLILCLTSSLFIINDLPNRMPSCRGRGVHGSSSASLRIDSTTAPGFSHHYNTGRCRSQRPQRKNVAKFLGSTVLLGTAVVLLTSQILFTLTIWYCQEGAVHQLHQVFLCVITAIGGILVVIGLVPWLCGAWVLAIESRCCAGGSRRRTTKRAPESGFPDPCNFDTVPRVQYGHGQLSGLEEHNRLSTLTLPPYTV